MNKDSQTAHDYAELAAEKVKAGIERTREQLSETVEALAAKTDVKSRAQHKASEVASMLSGSLPIGKERAQTWGRASSLFRKYRAQLAAVLAVVGGMFVIRRRRSR